MHKESFDVNKNKVISEIISEIKNSRKNNNLNYEYLTVEEFFYFACDHEEAVADMCKAGMDINNINNVKYLLGRFLGQLNKNDSKVLKKSESLDWLFKTAGAMSLNEEKSIEIIDLIGIIVVEKKEEDAKSFKVLKNIFINNGVSFEKIQEISLMRFIKSDDLHYLDEEEKELAEFSEKVENSENKKIEKYLTLMTAEGNPNKYTDAIGRDVEINDIIHAINKKKKSSIILVGEAGVGKTAIAEGLALKMIKNEVPELADHKLYELHVSSLVGGAKYRGDFEERVNKIINKITKETNVILFIDEIHMIMGAGTANNNNIDLANILKPYLANGKIKIIGTTTNEEKRKYIDPDAALERRFQFLIVDEPSKEDCLFILEKSANDYEKHHGVKYSKEILEKIIALSIRYIADKKLPDKAFDILDQVGVRARLRHEDHAEIKDVEFVVSKLANVPIENISGKENERVLALKGKLENAIFGQQEGIESLCNEIMIARSGIGENGKTKPIASLLFAGSTGVGKTEIVNELGRSLNMKVFRLDMSEYMDSSSASKLTGSAPGYVGYNEGSALLNYIKVNPHTIVLLDEFEKSHVDIHNLLLQILDNGFMKNNKGEKIDFRNTIFVLTTNAGSLSANEKQIGFSEGRNNNGKFKNEQIKKEIERAFKPELRNRLDQIVYFNSLDLNMSKQITMKKLKKIEGDLLEKGIVINFNEKLINYIANTVFEKDNKMGARPIDRKIKELVSRNLSIKMLNEEITSGDIINVDLDSENKLIITEEKKNNEKLENEPLSVRIEKYLI